MLITQANYARLKTSEEGLYEIGGSRLQALAKRGRIVFS